MRRAYSAAADRQPRSIADGMGAAASVHKIPNPALDLSCYTISSLGIRNLTAQASVYTARRSSRPITCMHARTLDDTLVSMTAGWSSGASLLPYTALVVVRQESGGDETARLLALRTHSDVSSVALVR